MKSLQALEEFGLEEREIKVYLALLQLEKGSVVSISKLCGLKRTTVYDVLEGLKNQGLVFIGFEGSKKIWFAQSPKRLEEIFNNRHEHLRMAMPELESLWHKSSAKPHIRYYEGVAGIKSAYGNFMNEFKKGQDFYIVSSGTDWFELDPEYFSNFVAERTRKGVQSWMITIGDSTTLRWAQDPRYKYKTKYFPPETKFVANTAFYNNKIIISLIEERFAVVIESKFLYEQQKQLFLLLWKSLPLATGE